MTTPKDLSPLYKAILEVYDSVAGVPKSDSAGVPYSFITMDAAIGAVRPAMIAAGLIAFPVDVDELVETIKTTNRQGEIKYAYRSTGKIVFRLVHTTTGESVDITIPSMAIDYSDKATNQFLGYAIKNFVLQTFMLQSGEPNGDQPPPAGRTVSGSAEVKPPKTRKIPDDSRRISWDADQVGALAESGAAGSPPHAATLLNRPDVILAKDAPPEWFGIWGKEYKWLRYKDGEKSGTVDDAVAHANKGLIAWVLENVPAEQVPAWIDEDLFKKKNGSPETEDDIPF